MIKVLDTLDQSGGVINLTGATSDYLLLPGQTAQLSYSAQTSLPLHIQTVEGIYDLILSSTSYTNNVDGGAALVVNNNVTVTFQLRGTYNYESTAHGGNATYYKTDVSGVFLGNIFATARISTFTARKSYALQLIKSDPSTNDYTMIGVAFSTDTSTIWTSLGTISFAAANTGVITIHRIA